MEDLASQMPFEDMLNPKKRSCKIPVCQVKKSEVYFYLLAEANVPVSRAAWYLKLLANFFSQKDQSEPTRGNKRSSKSADSASEWSKHLSTFMDEIWLLLCDPNPPRQKNHATGNNPLVICKMPTTREEVEGYWTYGNDIMKYLFSENMLDKEEIISWILKHGEKLRSGDEFQLRQLLPIFMFYLNDIVRNNLNSRRLAYICAQMIHWIKVEIPEENKKKEFDETKTEAPSPSNPNNNNNNEDDPKWRTLIWGLNTVMQLITLYSPGSLVWYEPVCAASHPGSPLDLLPQPPSQMVVAPGASDAFGGERQFKNQLWVMEREIIKRSVAVEVKWSWDKCRDPQTAQVVTSVLQILDKLDNTDLNREVDRLQPKPLLNNIFEQIFTTSITETENDAIVSLLCDWATTSFRSGRHRGVLVARLLAMKQDVIEENERRNVPYFQEHLFNYLHEKTSSIMERTRDFHSLNNLFGELIRHDVFSHTHYVSSLISRGEVTTKCNSEENHHFYFLKHIPIPHSLRAFFDRTDSEDGDDLKGERNQRAIALYGIGRNRKEAKKKRRESINNLYKLFSEQNEESSVNLYSSEHVKQFRKMSYYDRWSVGFFLAKKFSQPLQKMKNETIRSPQDMKLPTKNGMSCLIDLILESGNILNALEFISVLIQNFSALEKYWKKAKQSSNGEKNQEDTKSIYRLGTKDFGPKFV